MIRTRSKSFSIFGMAVVVAFVATTAVQDVSAAITYSCPSGLGTTTTSVVGSRCYAYFATDKAFGAAETACQGIGGHLTSVRSEAVNSAILAMASSNVIIGAADTASQISGASEGNFFWAGDSSAFFTGGFGGVPVSGAYTNWDSTEPNNFNGNENCVYMLYGFNDGKWNDATCGFASHYVCEVAADASGTADPVVSATPSESPTVHSGGVRPETLRVRMAIAALRWLLVTQPGALNFASASIITDSVSHLAAPEVASSSSATTVVLTSSHVSSVSSSISSSSSVSSSSRSVVSSSSSAKSSSSKKVVSSSAAPKAPSTPSDQRTVSAWRLNLHADARINSAVRLILTRTLTVKLLTIVDKDWAYVQTPTGLKGYVWRKGLIK